MESRHAATRPGARGASPLALVLGLATLATASITGVALRRHTIRSGARADWHAAFAEARAREAGLASQLGDRPVLWGEARAERAQPHYERALAEVRGWNHDWVLDSARSRPAERTALIRAGSRALEELYLGAHATDASWKHDWSLGFDLPQQKLGDMRKLSVLVQVKSDSLVTSGDDTRAVEVLLDFLQLAGDLTQSRHANNAALSAHLLCPDALLARVEDGSIRSWSQDALKKLRKGLVELDRRMTWQLPSLDYYAVTHAHGLKGFLDLERLEGPEADQMWGELDIAARWSQSVQYLRELTRLTDDLKGQVELGPDSAFAEIARFSEQRQALVDRNQVASTCMTLLDTLHRARFHSIGRFRMLVHALAPTNPPKDPWLATLLREETTESGRRLWLEYDADGFGANFLDAQILVAR